MKTTIPYEKIFAAFPPARQRKIKKRAAELIAEEFKWTSRWQNSRPTKKSSGFEAVLLS